MKFPLTLILLGSALSAAAQTPVALPHPAVQGQTVNDLGSPVLLASDDADEEDSGWLSIGDDGSDEDACNVEEGETCPKGGFGNGTAAPAGTVAPAANGLFGDGKAPKARTN